MLDAHIIDAIRESERRREEQRPQVALEIDPPRTIDGEPLEPEEAEPDGPVIIPLRPGRFDADGAV